MLVRVGGQASKIENVLNYEPPPSEGLMHCTTGWVGTFAPARRCRRVDEHGRPTVRRYQPHSSQTEGFLRKSRQSEWTAGQPCSLLHLTSPAHKQAAKQATYEEKKTEHTTVWIQSRGYALLRVQARRVPASVGELHQGEHPGRPLQERRGIHPPGCNFWVATISEGDDGANNKNDDDQDKVVAMVGLEVEPDHEGELHRMYVSADYRRYGLGKKLVAHLETWSKENGFKTVTLSTDAFMAEACKFYQSIGYEHTKTEVLRDDYEQLRYAKCL